MNLIILSGYLGSGKTTLLRNVLNQTHGRRVGLVVNEFGAIGIDGATLRAQGDAPLIELANGCVCCAAGSDFLLAVEELQELAQPEVIVVEASGLADPVALVRRIRGADLRVDALIAVADAVGIADLLPTSALAQRQIRAADMIVLSKIDQVDAVTRAAAEQAVRRENPRATLWPVAHGAIPAAVVLGLQLEPGIDHELEQSTFHNHEIEAWAWQDNSPLERKSLLELLGNLPPNIVRAKGIVHCTDAPWASLINVVGGRIADEAIRLRELPQPLNRFVLLGSGVRSVSVQWEARFSACADSAERQARWWAER